MVILRETFIDDMILTATADGELIAARRVTAPPVIANDPAPRRRRRANHAAGRGNVHDRRASSPRLDAAGRCSPGPTAASAKPPSPLRSRNGGASGGSTTATELVATEL